MSETIGGIPHQTEKKILPPNPSDIGACGGRVTEGDGDGDGHSIYLRTLINQTQGLSADCQRPTACGPKLAKKH